MLPNAFKGNSCYPFKALEIIQRLTESKLYDIDIEELRRRVLNTEDDRLKEHQEKPKEPVSLQKCFMKGWEGLSEVF